MLGSIEQRYLIELVEALLADDANTLLNTIAHLAELGADFSQVLEELLDFIHEIALSQAVPNSPTTNELASKLTAETVQLYYQIGLIGRRDLPLAPTARSGFEMVMLRMLAFTPRSTTPSSRNPQSSSSSSRNPNPTQSAIRNPTQSAIHDKSDEPRRRYQGAGKTL